MSRSTRWFGAGALASAALLAAGLAPGSAAAAPSTPGASPSTPKASPASLSRIQAEAAAAISKRVGALQAAVAKVEADKALGSDGASLVSYLQQDVTPLENLGAKIASDTSLSQARADLRAVFVDYRVYALVLPAAWQAARADTLTVTVIPRLEALSAKAQAHLTPQNQATLGPMIASLNSDISAASAASSGVAATVLAYTPAQWNADHSLLSATRSSLQSALADVKNARSELRQIIQYLRGNRPASRTGVGAGPAATGA